MRIWIFNFTWQSILGILVLGLGLVLKFILNSEWNIWVFGIATGIFLIDIIQSWGRY